MRAARAIAPIACLLTALACGRSSPTPSPTARPTEIPDQAAGSLECDGFRLRWSGNVEDEGGGVPRLRVERDGRTIVDLRTADAFEKLRPLRCEDLDGDRSPDLLYEHFTGGAHCCFEDVVIPLRSPDTRLLEAELGNYGGLEPRQLDSDEALELAGSSDLYAYFHVSFAASPAIPLVFDFDGERFVVATGDFPDLVRSDIEEAFGRLEETEGGDEELLRGAAVGVYGSYLILGRGPEGVHEVERRVPSGVAAWLRGVAAEAEQVFSERYGASRAPTGAD